MPISYANNVTATIHEFILLGFLCSQEIEILLFIVFSIIYIMTLLGNGAIICVVWWDQKVHTPMYILLVNFCFLEICYISSKVPNMLLNFLSKTKTISYNGCILQFYIFLSLCATELFFLSLMAFDSSNMIDHYLCDLGAMLAISCVPVPKITLTCSIFSVVILFITLIFILLSYTLVLRTVLQLPKGSGSKKAFSTCASHLVVVSLFYGSIIVMYVTPGAANQPGMQKFVTMFYSIATPLLNPLIYSPRNKEMKLALRKVLCKI
ncbi:olfactory receptor 11G2-like [Loxodonta africana]|uniref:olfactory receptor 11G2-like n=1 Tax=Loxodonta africana TaxID=9785 RepID=UPI0030D50BE9